VTQITLNTTGGSKLTLAGVNSYSGGTVVDAGVLEATTATNALPASGGVTVNEYGELLLNVSGLTSPSCTGVGSGNPITVNGGTLTLANLFNAGHNRPITINGGTLNSTFTDHGDNGNYVNNSLS
jgi:autotransporter-associated beta strand protein